MSFIYSPHIELEKLTFGKRQRKPERKEFSNEKDSLTLPKRKAKNVSDFCLEISFGKVKFRAEEEKMLPVNEM